MTSAAESVHEHQGVQEAGSPHRLLRGPRRDPLFRELGQASWYVILASALAWFGLEASENRGRLTSAMEVGAFLLIFDFIFENSGWLAGLWYTKSEFHVGVVPLQVMGIAFFGGSRLGAVSAKEVQPLALRRRLPRLRHLRGPRGAASHRAGALRLPAVVDELRRVRRLFPDLGDSALRQVRRLLPRREEGRCFERDSDPYSSIRLIFNEASATKRIVEKEIAAMSSGRFE